MLADGLIDVGVEARLLGVERLCAIDVGDGYDDQFEPPIHGDRSYRAHVVETPPTSARGSRPRVAPRRAQARGPLVRRIGQRQEQDIWAGLKRCLEAPVSETNDPELALAVAADPALLARAGFAAVRPRRVRRGREAPQPPVRPTAEENRPGGRPGFPRPPPPPRRPTPPTSA